MLVILIAGGTASGKTTVANKITELLTARNIQDKVTIINMDSYYVDLSNIDFEERKKLNFDHPASVDWELLYQHLEDLLNRKSIKKPIYSYVEYTRTGRYEIVHPAPVIIIEGLFALYDPKIRKLANIKIFVEAPDDIRLIRRIYRDIKERGRSIDEVINQYLNYVRPMYVEFIKPTKKYADVIIQNEKDMVPATEMLAALIEKYIALI
ncbi:MAG: uridine kinase [bacterium]